MLIQVEIIIQANKIVKPFVEPLKTNPWAIAMVDCGNQYFKEEGVVPTPTQLSVYMVEKHGTALGLTYDKKNKSYDLNGEPLTDRRFKARYKDYLVDSE